MCKKPFFPDVVQLPNGNNNIDRKMFRYYPLLRMCIMNLISRRSINEYLYNKGISNIVLYAINDFTSYMIGDLSLFNGCIDILYVCDRNYNNYRDGFYGRDVYGISRLISDYDQGLVEKVIICNLICCNEICEELREAGLEFDDIMTIDSLLYAMWS